MGGDVKNASSIVSVRAAGIRMCRWTLRLPAPASPWSMMGWQKGAMAGGASLCLRFDGCAAPVLALPMSSLACSRVLEWLGAESAATAVHKKARPRGVSRRWTDARTDELVLLLLLRCLHGVGRSVAFTVAAGEVAAACVVAL